MALKLAFVQENIPNITSCLCIFGNNKWLDCAIYFFGGKIVAEIPCSLDYDINCEISTHYKRDQV
jgi:hypothetical protein